MLDSIFGSKNRALLLLSILLGVAWSVSLSLVLAQLKGFSPNQFLLLIIILAVIFFVLSYWLLGKILPGISKYSLSTKLLWIFGCLLIGISMVVLIPLNTAAPSYHRLKVIATGDHNKWAKGSEVWLYSMRTRSGLNLNRGALSSSHGWEYRQGTLLSYEKQPASIEYNGFFSGDLTLTFGSHPWSGQVRIFFDGNEKVLDLYSGDTASKAVVLPIASSYFLSVFIILADILALAFLAFIAIVWFVTGSAEPVESVDDLSEKKDLIKPETAFLILGLLFGIVFALVTPPFQVADEDQHFSYAYAISTGQFYGIRSVLPHSIQELMMATNHLPLEPDAKVSYRELFRFIDSPLARSNLDPSFYQGVAKVNPVPYAPIVIGIEFAKLFNLNALAFFFFGRFFQLCAWILISYSALKLLPGFKWVFLLLLLSPMSLSIAASYSVDAITNSISFLWFCLCFHYSSVKENSIGPKSQFLFISIAALLALMKPPYQLLILLFFMIPRANFGSQRQYLRTAALLFAISLILFLFSLRYLFMNDLSTTNSRPELDFMSQAHHLLDDPLEFPKIIVRSLKLFWTFYYTSYIGRLGWLDTILPTYIYLTFPLSIFLISLVDQGKRLSFAPWQKLLSLLVGCALFSAVVLSLYLTWTPVGSKTLEGLQGRYLIPIGPVLIPLLTSKFLSKSPGWKGIPVIAYLILVLSITARTLILRYYVG